MENRSPKAILKSTWRKNMPKEKYEKVGMISTIPKALYFQGLSGFFFSWGARRVQAEHYAKAGNRPAIFPCFVEYG